jgi:hypothetical protein
MSNCPNCHGPIAIRNPTGTCDHLYWPDYLTPEARKLVERVERDGFRECDVCGEMRDDVSTFYYPPVGDTSACAKCRGDDA